MLETIRHVSVHEAEKSENFVTLLKQFYNKALYSDLVLHIRDSGDAKKPPLLIHTHLIVLYSASHYIQRFLACFATDPSRYSIQTDNPLVPNQIHLNLELDYASGFDDALIQLFFSLFYVNRFDEAHLKANGLADTLHENIMALYTLASYFAYDTLLVYLEQYLKASMCVAYFTPLTNLCLSRHPVTGEYTIERKHANGSLFTRLLQWYTCCIDERDVTNDETTTTTPTIITTETDTTIGPIKCNRRYYEENKASILGQMQERIVNLQAVDIPQKRVQRLDATTIQLDYYRRICNECLGECNKKNTINSFYYINMGFLTLDSARFFLRLKKKVPYLSPRRDSYHRNNVLEMTMVRKYYGDHGEQPTRLEEKDEDEKYHCRSHVALLSRKKHRDKYKQEYGKKSLFTTTEINSFDTHPVKYCYEARCDHCSSVKPVYIILLHMVVSRENSPIEDMSMMVEMPHP